VASQALSLHSHPAQKTEQVKITSMTGLKYGRESMAEDGEIEESQPTDCGHEEE
jgi:hypothetical protein